MPPTSLPDEIISEILSPALKVDDADFSANAYLSPFAHFSEPPSAYLLVCKAWLRVSTPLLYGVVVLRSTAQAKALSAVVASNNQLGSFVRKLRVEAGYGPAMHTLLKYTPNITDLFVSFNLSPRDSTDGLCRGLELINPIRLILADIAYYHSGHNMASKLADALIQVSPNWNKLTVLDISSPSPYGPSNRVTRISEAIAREKRLSTIVIGSVKFGSRAWDSFKRCPLQVIRISTPLQSQSELDSAISLQKTLAAVGKTSLRYQINLGAQTAIPQANVLPNVNLNPNFVPMAAAPQEIQDSVWSLILEFASFPINRTANKLLLVCKSFSRLALPHIYAKVTLLNRKSALKLARTAVQSPAHALHIRELHLSHNYNAYASRLIQSEAPADFDDPILEILRNTRALETFTSRYCTSFDPEASSSSTWLGYNELSVSWDAFTQLSQTANIALRELCVDVPARQGNYAGTPRQAPVVFNAFSNLRKLHWRSYTMFDTDFVSAAYEDAFPRLEELQIWEAHATLLEVLSLMKLPALKNLTILSNIIHASLRNLLRAHGNSLKTLVVLIDNLNALVSTSRSNGVLHLCPNLTELTILCRNVLFRYPNSTFPATNMLHSATPVRALTKIKFILPATVWAKSSTLKWETFFADLSSQVKRTIPNLQEVQLASAPSWPTNERDMVKNPWIRVAEGLLAVGVQVSDKTGTKWRSRLSTKPPVRTMTTRTSARRQNGL
ncbi:hypothetical protein C8F01DRAFT_1376079 [Mycena amicta]|nr:hypothetical protein C8F01DRAFT_1376079 [Mycena amicta]